MRVVILGSGVVGVTSAWYLSQAGHEVTVIDRESGPAPETSSSLSGCGRCCATAIPATTWKTKGAWCASQNTAAIA